MDEGELVKTMPSVEEVIANLKDFQRFESAITLANSQREMRIALQNLQVKCRVVEAMAKELEMDFRNG